MTSMFSVIGKSISSHFIQFLVGLLLSVFLYSLPFKEGKTEKETDYIKIMAASFFGIIVPLGIYGLIPVLAALHKRGVRFCMLLSLLVANSLFNLLVPFSDPGFAWRTGALRLIVAFFAGIIAGVVVKFLRFEQDDLLRTNYLNSLVCPKKNLVQFSKSLLKSVVFIGVFLLIIGIVDLFWQRFGLPNTLNLMYAPQLSFVLRYFILLSVKPFFLLVMVVVTAIINPFKLAAIFLLLKRKGIILYLSCLLSLIIILTLLSILQ